MADTFGFIERAFLSRSNPENNTVDPVSGIPGRFDVAFSGTVRTHLVKSEPVPFEQKLWWSAPPKVCAANPHHGPGFRPTVVANFR